jgi:hypothetical protein
MTLYPAFLLQLYLLAGALPLFGFRTELQQGNLDMLKRTWETAKQYLQEKTEVI